jgi:hypothetical protein
MVELVDGKPKASREVELEQGLPVRCGLPNVGNCYPHLLISKKPTEEARKQRTAHVKHFTSPCRGRAIETLIVQIAVFPGRKAAAGQAPLP